MVDATVTTMPEPTTRSIRVRGMVMHMAEAGPEDGPLALLLHGFPEFWYGWRHQIGPLAAAGLRVVAPDQRGYGATGKPTDLGPYHLDELAADVIALADAFGRDRIRVVGHDWGGLVAWRVAAQYSERIDRAAILNAPHPDVFMDYVRRHPSQALRSSYIGFFQLPWLPETMLRAGDFALLRRALVTSSRPGTFEAATLDRYAAAWAEPGALTGMLNWYRALRLPRRPAPSPVQPPVLVLWGERDTALEAGLAEDSLARCADGRVQRFPDATHWVQHEEPEAVNRALVGFLTADTNGH
ncbi:alpha/beta fold hydrolase [Methylobacterium nodulans]|uniref:Alpha/beta hydrolase fold protein n=1 Tax=Methylobacterium nodulans (strain LMG 21967 / CNCM I-2342 / ORS 2060) TaxID=460265 RepID=B8IV05_METNO|nr:alpha/beta hydrolase [Methylobacterium nodulans]ACL59063.1 alpha/beta hydrolase fold protein [Methylobacterium nodulans ORS 2060]